MTETTATHGWQDQDEPREIHSELLEINMGPQHPATHGVLRLVIHTDGEIVHKVVPYIGYLHRCAEKTAEGCDYRQWMVYTDRFDYLAPMNMNFGYAVAVENMLEVTVPERAEYIRVICAELQRIASHLIALGTFGLDMGAWTPLLYCFREREEILNIFERLSGGRMLYNYYDIGGLRFDAYDGFAADVLDIINVMEQKIPEYNTLLSYNKIAMPTVAPARCCAGPACPSIVARTTPTPSTTASSSRSPTARGRWGRSATAGTATWCACARCTSRAASCARPWTDCPRVRS